VRFPAIIAILTVAGVAHAASPQAPLASATSKKAALKSASTKTVPAKSTAAKTALTKTTPGKGAPAKSTIAKTTKTAVTQTAASKAVSKVNTKAPSGKALSSKAAISKAASGKSKKQAAPPRGPIAQQQPTVDRYREIQQALADKGYFSGMPDGNWGPDSAEALKRFQREQNLEADGKIGALSLMALGLGPRRGTASAQAAAPPEGTMPVDPPPVAQPAP
jgi:hypothetical protein